MKKCVAEAIGQLNRTAEFIPNAVPEHSALGESQSNGVAERNVQKFEDLLRTHKAALEDNLKVRIPSNHLRIPRLIEHVAMLKNKYSINADGKTPYEHMHGRKCNAKIVEFGERCYYYVPKKLRAKLDKR